MRHIIGSSLVCALLFSSAWAEEGKDGKPGLQKLLDEFDNDGDGKLSEDERAEAKKALAERRAKREGEAPKGRPTREQIIEKFDENGNGELDPDEREKARAAFRDRRGKGKGGQDGRPQISPEMREKIRAKLIAEFDEDNDGKLTGAEREKAQKFMREKMRQSQGREGQKGPSAKGKGRDQRFKGPPKKRGAGPGGGRGPGGGGKGPKR